MVGNSWFEIRLDQHQSTLIYGLNGVGKTTLLDALTFALFGKAFRDTNKPLLVNSINKSDCLVELYFSIGKKQYKIIRGIKPNIFEIYIDGVMKHQDASIKDYQHWMEENILKFNFKAFSQIVVLGNKSFVSFMKLPALDRRNVIEDLLDIKVFSSMAKIVKSRITDINTEIDTHKIESRHLQSNIDIQQKYHDDYVKQFATKHEANLKEIEKAKHSIQILREQQSDINIQIGNLVHLCKDRDGLNLKLKKQEQLETKIDQNKLRVEKDLGFFANNDVCPTCTQTIDPMIKANHIGIHSHKKQQLDDGLIAIRKEIDFVQTELSFIDTYLQQIEQCRMNLATSLQETKNLEKWIESKSKENEEFKNNKFDSQLLEQAKGKLSYITGKIESYQEQLKYLDFAKQILKDDGIKTVIIKQYLPLMNNYINKYLSYMDFSVNFSLNENFEESIMSRHRDEFLYGNFSEGQKLRLDLAILFAWRSVAKQKNSLDTNLLIMDEVLDSSLDNPGIEDFITFMQVFKDTNIFIISPRMESQTDKFQHKIHMISKGGFTEIEE